ncbi:hypothetical protein ACOM2C_16190 [Pseudarthrobacter sp. So.54]
MPWGAGILGDQPHQGRSGAGCRGEGAGSDGGSLLDPGGRGCGAGHPRRTQQRGAQQQCPDHHGDALDHKGGVHEYMRR